MELKVGVLGIPEVQCEVGPGTERIPQELSRPVLRIVAEKLDPGPVRPIDCFKAFFALRLDFELPED